MEFGTFTWIDDGGRPIDQLYDDHLRLARQADELGFACYHLAEHHNTPLGMAPSPGLFLAAVARETERIRLGPLVYLLPLYRTQRLVEEVCMLDHLSHGRLELGVGRGVSPYELGHNGVDPGRSRDLFRAGLGHLLAGLRGDGSAFGDLGGAPIEIRPHQRPYPPLTMASTNPETAEWAGRHGISLMGLGPAAAWAPVVDTYRAALADGVDRPDRYNGHVTDPRVGLNRQVVVAETDEEAMDVARAGFGRFARSFLKLWEDNGDRTYASRVDLEASVAADTVLVGSPATVASAVADTVAATGINYLSCSFAWGDLPPDLASRSMELFATEVRPAVLATLDRSATGTGG